MSFQGQLRRGMKWYSLRNKDGLLPKGISEDEEKMKEVNVYLDYVKGKDEKAVIEDIIKARNLERNGKMRTPVYKELIGKIGLREDKEESKLKLKK